MAIRKNCKSSILMVLVLAFLLCAFVSSQAFAATKTRKVKVTAKVSKSKITVVQGNKIKLAVYNGKKKLSTTTAKYKSSKKAVATVSKKGVVTAKKAGKAVITINYKKKSAKITVTVKKKVVPKSINLDKKSVTLNIKDTYKLKATIKPSNATDKTIKWLSSDISVAAISNGVISAKKEGTTTITAETANGKTAVCTVTVKAAASPTMSETPSSEKPSSEAPSSGQEQNGNIITVNDIQFDISEAPSVMNIFGGNDKNSVLAGVLQSDKYMIVKPLVTISEKDVTWKINNGNNQICVLNHVDPGALANNVVSVPNVRNAIAYIEYGKSTSSANQYLATVTPACKTGTFTIAMYFKGSLVRQTKVIVHSADYREVELRRIVSAIDKELPANPTAQDLGATTARYVYQNFSYDYPPAGDGFDCTEGANVLGMVYQCHGYRVMFHSTEDDIKTYYVHPIITTLGHINAYALDNNGNVIASMAVQGHFLKDWNK